MPSYQYASEWLNFARKHLETAKLLLRENHYTDIIAIELHQTLEPGPPTCLVSISVLLPERMHSKSCRPAGNILRGATCRLSVPIAWFLVEHKNVDSICTARAVI